MDQQGQTNQPVTCLREASVSLVEISSRCKHAIKLYLMISLLGKRSGEEQSIGGFWNWQCKQVVREGH